MSRGNQRPGGDGGGSLNIVVETAQLIPVAFEQFAGIFLREIFKLQQNVGPAVFHGVDKHVHKFGILIVADTRMAPAHIQWVVQMLLIIGTDIQHNRQGGGRMYPAAGGIKR